MEKRGPPWRAASQEGPRWRMTVARAARWRSWDWGGEQCPGKGCEGQQETTTASSVPRGTTAERGGPGRLWGLRRDPGGGGCDGEWGTMMEKEPRRTPVTPGGAAMEPRCRCWGPGSPSPRVAPTAAALTSRAPGRSCRASPPAGTPGGGGSARGRPPRPRRGGGGPTHLVQLRLVPGGFKRRRGGGRGAALDGGCGGTDTPPPPVTAQSPPR